MNKFREERYIGQFLSSTTKKWSFKVRYNGITKTFAEKDFLSASQAFKEAKKFRDNLILEENIEIIRPKQTTVREVFKQSFDLIPIREETQRKLNCYFDKYINLDIPIQDLKQEHIITSLNGMIENSTNDTISRVFSIYKRIIKTALIKEYITKDITLSVILPKSHKLKAQKRQMITDKQTLEEVCKLIQKHFISPYDKRMYQLMIWFLYYTGCRPAEMFALEKDDIKKDYIDINKEMGSSLRDNNIVRPCKTELSHRQIPIADSLKPIIQEAMELSKSEIIFAMENGSHFNSTYVGDRLHGLAKKHGIEFFMYQIRHLFCTDLMDAGADPKTIESLMGHADLKTTYGYLVTNDGKRKNAINHR